ncbi:MAG: hypothetical protein ACR2NZ_06360 [Rubripirellula sp.]
MQVSSEEIAIHDFTPDDGSESAAIKVVHRTSQQEALHDETPSQLENLRRAMIDLMKTLNPNPDHIKPAKLVMFDRVRVQLPQSVHEGRITKLSWDFTSSEWKYFVDCPNDVVSAWYVIADLDLLEENPD